MTDKELYLSILKSCVKREGINELIDWLENKSSFFADPASAKHHLSVEGGLCLHSLHVFDRLTKLAQAMFCPNGGDITEDKEKMESVAIVGLLHDICKVGTYKKEPKNVKTYDADKVRSAQRWQVKHDDNGDFIWETVLQYANDDQMPYGHGEKSVYIISGFLKLTREEAFAIRYHMGSWNDGEKSNASKAFEMYPLAFLVHVADEWATFVDEKE